MLDGNENEKETEQKVDMDGKAADEITVGGGKDEKKGREKTEIGQAKETNPTTSASGYVRQLPSATRSLFADPQALDT